MQDDVVRPRKLWEQHQMKTVVPVTACSAKHGRAAAPRAAPICPGKPWAAGRAVSGIPHGMVAASEAVATCSSVRVCVDSFSHACLGAAAADAKAAPSSGHLPAAHCGAVANGLVAVRPLEAVIQKGHAAQISKGRNR